MDRSRLCEAWKRPLAETYYNARLPLPEMDGFSKSFRGRVPASGAGLDVTTEVWQALGVDKSLKDLEKFSGYVDIEWFVKEPEPVTKVAKPKKAAKMASAWVRFRDRILRPENVVDLVYVLISGKGGSVFKARVSKEVRTKLRELAAEKMGLEVQIKEQGKQLIEAQAYIRQLEEALKAKNVKVPDYSEYDPDSEFEYEPEVF